MASLLVGDALLGLVAARRVRARPAGRGRFPSAEPPCSWAAWRDRGRPEVAVDAAATTCFSVHLVQHRLLTLVIPQGTFLGLASYSAGHVLDPPASRDRRSRPTSSWEDARGGAGVTMVVPAAGALLLDRLAREKRAAFRVDARLAVPTVGGRENPLRPLPALRHLGCTGRHRHRWV